MRRLAGQGLSPARFSSAGEVVRWMGCVQAQDFAMGKWGVGLRMGAGVGAGVRAGAAVTDAGIEADFNAGRILRTHVLRSTWHFVLPEDIGWLLKLTGPRIQSANQSMQRRLGLDKAVMLRSKKIMSKVLEEPMTRGELAVLFRRAKINTDDIRMSYLLMDAEVEGLICSGPKKGKQFTFRLLTERGLDFDGDAATGELARRYFVSRGPATVVDFAWWGGLSLSLAKRGLEVVGSGLESVVVKGQEYWFDGSGIGAGGGGPGSAFGAGRSDSGAGRSGSASGAGRSVSVLLLPAWDEYTVAYKDRSDFLHVDHVGRSSYGLKPVVVVNGRVVGVWRRVLERERVVVEVSGFAPLSGASMRAIGVAAKRFGGFLGKGVEVVYG
jgi:hypothetical protein